MLHIVLRMSGSPTFFTFLTIANLRRHTQCVAGAVNVLHLAASVSYCFCKTLTELSRSSSCTEGIVTLPDAETMCRFFSDELLQCPVRADWRPLYPHGIYIVSNCA